MSKGMRLVSFEFGNAQQRWFVERQMGAGADRKYYIIKKFPNKIIEREHFTKVLESGADSCPF